MTWFIAIDFLLGMVKCIINSGPNLHILKIAMATSEATYLYVVSLAVLFNVSRQQSSRHLY